MYSKYYQAEILKEKTWFLSACLRNESNLVFARAIKNKDKDQKNPIFEFFVTEDQEEFFLKIMEILEKRGVILKLFQPS